MVRSDIIELVVTRVDGSVGVRCTFGAYDVELDIWELRDAASLNGEHDGNIVADLSKNIDLYKDIDVDFIDTSLDIGGIIPSTVYIFDWLTEGDE